jgi:hypothetical protein
MRDDGREEEGAPATDHERREAEMEREVPRRYGAGAGDRTDPGHRR